MSNVEISCCSVLFLFMGGGGGVINDVSVVEGEGFRPAGSLCCDWSSASSACRKCHPRLSGFV